MDANALVSEDDLSDAAVKREELEALGRSVTDAKVTLIRLLSVHKELSKRLDTLTFLHRVKTHGNKDVHVSVLDSDSFSFASPSSWQFRTPSPRRSSPHTQHRRVWSFTTAHSPLVSEFHPGAKRELGYWTMCLVVLMAVLLAVLVLWRLKASLVIT